MSKLKSLIIGLALCSAQAYAQESALKVWMDESVTVTADGQTVTYLTVYENNPDVDYISFNMEIAVPKGIKVYQKKAGRGTKNDIELSVRATESHSITCNMPDDGLIKIACSSGDNSELYPDDEDGNIYNPIFTIGLVAEPSTYNGAYMVEMSDIWFNYRDEADGQIKAHILDHVEYCDFTVTGGTDFPGVDYIMPSEGCGTMILPFDCEIPSGMNVYLCTGISGDNVLLLSKESSIAANTPYIVEGEAGKYSLAGIYKALYNKYSTQYMTGVYELMPVPDGAYVMQNHASTYGVGFYKVSGQTINVSPYHCYLNAIGEGASAVAFRLQFDNVPTGIDNTDCNGNAIVDVYNATGQMVRKNVRMSRALKGLATGVYVINDKKYVVK